MFPSAGWVCEHIPKPFSQYHTTHLLLMIYSLVLPQGVSGIMVYSGTKVCL